MPDGPTSPWSRSDGRGRVPGAARRSCRCSVLDGRHPPARGCAAAAPSARGWRVVLAGPAGVMDGIRPLDEVVAIPSNLSPGRLATAWRQLRRVLSGVDLVHAHGLKAGWLAMMGAAPGATGRRWS